MYNDANDDKEVEYNHFLTVTSGYSDTKIDTFPILSNGALDSNNKKIVTSPTGPLYPEIHPSNNYLYVPNYYNPGGSPESSISLYQTDIYGTLTNIPIGTITVGTHPYSIRVHPSGKFLYVSNNNDTNAGTISMYSINNNGTLTDLSQPSISSSGNGPTRMAIDPSGNFLYVVNKAQQNIASFQINSNGILSSPSSTGNADTSGITDVIVALNGYVYIIGNSGISSYDRSTNTTTRRITMAISNGYLAIHPSGNYLYFTSTNMKVNVCRINSDGTLSGIISSVTPYGGQIYDMLVHPSGNYIYLAEWGNSRIYYLIINNDGTITEGPTYIPYHAYGLTLFRKKIK
jgi:DNA-binding beta-propeller fold protein YncE